MARSLKKGPYVSEKLLGKLKKLQAGSREIVKTWCRSCTIVPEMIGYSFGVHNGKEHILVSVTEDMVGHKLGEFSPTTKFLRHGGRMQKDIEQKTVQKEVEKTKPEEKNKK